MDAWENVRSIILKYSPMKKMIVRKKPTTSKVVDTEMEKHHTLRLQSRRHYRKGSRN